MTKDKRQRTKDKGQRAKRRTPRPSATPPVPPLIPPLVLWWLRNLFPGLSAIGVRGRGLPRFKRSQEHLRNAAIEVLEGMKACLDETLEWLREEPRNPAELKKIKVE